MATYIVTTVHFDDHTTSTKIYSDEPDMELQDWFYQEYLGDDQQVNYFQQEAGISFDDVFIMTVVVEYTEIVITKIK
jgi:hypothetical protein